MSASIGTKRNTYGIWSRQLFADSSVVDGPVRLIFIAGMAAEDPEDGHILHLGDLAAQSDMAFEKIKTILAEHEADMSHIVRMIAYLTDMREKKLYEGALHKALGGVEPPPHSLLGVSSLAWPGMMVEVEVTAAVPLAIKETNTACPAKDSKQPRSIFRRLASL